VGTREVNDLSVIFAGFGILDNRVSAAVPLQAGHENQRRRFPEIFQ
jgi:hypothetical protein